MNILLIKLNKLDKLLMIIDYFVLILMKNIQKIFNKIILFLGKIGDFAQILVMLPKVMDVLNHLEN